MDFVVEWTGKEMGREKVNSQPVFELECELCMTHSKRFATLIASLCKSI